jgi:hypothetical protein
MIIFGAFPSNLRLRRRSMIGTTRQKSKILAAQRHIFSVNALNNVNLEEAVAGGNHFKRLLEEEKRRQRVLSAFS